MSKTNRTIKYERQLLSGTLSSSKEEYANQQLSSLNASSYVKEKVQRSEIEDFATNNISKAPNLHCEDDMIHPLLKNRDFCALVLNEVALIQSLDRRTGSVFYLDVKYDNTKGAVTAGDTMLSSTTGTNRTLAGQTYAYSGVIGEAIASSSSKSIGQTITHTCTYKPGITSGTVVLEAADGTVLGTDADTATVITGDGGTGTVDYTTGAISFTLATTTDSSGVAVNYRYQYDKPIDAYNDQSGVPKASVSLTQSPVTAIDFPLAASWSIGAAIDLSKAHGMDLESELVKYLGGEVKCGPRVDSNIGIAKAA
jgi:hypothetical protein